MGLTTALSVLVGVASAHEDEGQTESPMTPALIREADESPDRLQPPPTDPEAAKELPHDGLERGEALELLDAVFGAEVEEPGGVFDNLEVDGYLSDHAAVVTNPEPPESAIVIGEEEEPPESATSEPGLVESSLPLRTEAPNGEKVPVNLSLERSEGELQPAAPLVEAEIPSELGDGISLGNSGIKIEFVDGAEQRAPSNVEEEAAFYPNVQPDTDLLVAPIPTGIETWTQLRTAESPTAQTIHLGLPEGAELTKTAVGGAEATLNGRTLLNVPPVTAVDAAGTEVPVSMSAQGHDLEITVSPSPGAQLPILVDPTFQEESWNWIWGTSNFSSWYPYHTDPSYLALTYGYPATENHALDLTSGFPGSAGVLSRAEWSYYVPRQNSDMEKYGVRPESFIQSAQLEAAMFLLQGNSSYYPVEDAGIVDEDKGEWVSVGTHRGTEGEISGWSGKYTFPNSNPTTHEPDTHARIFAFQLVTLEGESQAKYRSALAGEAMVTVGDHNTPQITELSPPGAWYNEPTEAPSIGYSVSDPGLGVYELQTETWTTNGTPGISKSYYKVGCIGVASSPCPRTETSSQSPHPSLIVVPKNMPEGRDTVTVKAADPLGAQGFPAPGVGGGEDTTPHLSAQSVQVKVDHSAPTLSVTGTVTEQGALGTAKPQYSVKYGATDGTEEAPTLAGSGAATFNRPADIALDAAENRWVADANNNSIVKASESGAVLGTYSAVGSTESLSHPTGIDIDPSGNVWVVDSGHNRLVEFNSKGEWMRKVGKLGSGNSEFSSPTGIAVGANGNVWVADTANNRVQEFSSTGTFLGAFGGKGAGNGQFSEPSSIDVGPGNSVWVTDTGNNRIEELGEKGEFIAAYGSLGSGNGQLNHPTGIEVDTRGSVWVVDQGNGRVEQFSERGEYLGKFGTPGTGEGQFTFSAPAGITTNVAGTLWVTDSGNNRVSRWNGPKATRSGVRKVAVKVDGKVVQEPSVTCPQGGCPVTGEWTLHSGEYAAGSHTVEVTATDGVGLATTRNINITLNPPAPSLTLSGTITEQGSLGTTRPRYKLRVAASAEEGTGTPPGSPNYLSSFGSAGSGSGQLSHPAGIAVDAQGNLWVVDTSNNRIEGFNSSGGFIKAVGSAGAGNGQFSRPTAIAIDPEGNFWVADAGNNRLQQFGHGWEFIRTVGTAGSGNGQFNNPEGLAIDSLGHIWVADTSNSRVQELTGKGAFIKVVPGLGTIQPTAVAAGPGGNIWIADWAHNKVVDYMEAFNTSWSFGSEGTGSGQFKHPDAVSVDSSGNVWVGDEGNRRIQEFNENGEYIAQFGSAGSGAGQFVFSYPMGLAVDSKNNIWVSDTGNNRVQHWRQPARSQVTTEITLDGNRVDLGEALCRTETCPISREWTLESSAYSPGQHTLVAKATDGYGQWTSKTRTIEIQRDTTKPALQVGGELANAPEGWVQQESYGFNASATDEKGYGVTSLIFRIDGTAVLSKTQACGEGNCSASITGGVNMAPYSGGAHEAEVVATDGAGNVSTKRWTINVDPEGHISTAEATATVEAAEATGAPTTIAPTNEDEGLSGNASTLGLEATGSGFSATGTAAPVEVSSSPGGSLTVEIPPDGGPYGCNAGIEAEVEEPIVEVAGEEREAPIEIDEEEGPCPGSLPNENPGDLVPVEIKPITTAEGATNLLLIEENATVSADTSPSTDTTIRPLNDGGMIFQDIRDASAPEEYSYRVSLSEEQELRQINEKTVEVFLSGGSPSFTITAKPASDAIGTSVPTTLQKTGRDVVTLTVHHRAGHEGQPFVYPVVGGSGWEGGFETVEVNMDNPQPEGGEVEEGEIGELFVSPPEPATFEEVEEEAGTSSVEPVRHFYRWIRCQLRAEIVDPTNPIAREGFHCGNPFTRSESSERVVFNFGIRGHFFVLPGQWVAHAGVPTHGIECDKELFPEHFDYHGEYLVEPHYFINPAEKCVWWGKTVHGGGKKVFVGEHLSPFGEWNTGVGHTGEWETKQVGSALYIWSNRTPDGYSIERHKTTCIDC
jgi:sugar lactone lactonase YvrE